MTTHNMTTNLYKGHEAPADLVGRIQVIARRFIGTDLTTLKDGSAGANGDAYKIIKLAKHQLVTRVWTIVTDADDTGLTLDIGYTDDTNASATAFETNAALNSTGVTQSSDDLLLFDDNGYWLTITPSAVTTIDDDFEMVIAAEILDLSAVGITTALTAPV